MMKKNLMIDYISDVDDGDDELNICVCYSIMINYLQCSIK